MPGGVVARWVKLAGKHSVKGGDVFDVQLVVATMLENGSRRIHTYNRSDFEQFDEREVVTPVTDRHGWPHPAR